MLKISAVVITFNEEKNIKRCLDSLVDVVDEIVVVDSFSTDKTKEICNEIGVKFIEHEFEGHIEQKNWAAEQAKYDFLLSLDADEALSKELQKSIIKIKNNFSADGYSMNRMTNFCGHWVKYLWYPDRKLRLWNRKKGSWGGENPHDKLILEPGSIEKKIKGDILHYSYNSVDENISQINKFTNISSQAMNKKGKRTSIFGMILHSIYRFIKFYIFKLGILDGKVGFMLAVNSAFYVFLKYEKLMLLNDKNKLNNQLYNT